MERLDTRAGVSASILGIFIAIYLFASAAQAQDPRLLTGRGSFSLGAVTVAPSVDIGYQRMGINFSMPANLVPGSLLLQVPPVGTSNVDFKLRNADVWVGSVRLELATASPFAIFLGGEASAQRNVAAVTTEFPAMENLGLYLPVQWMAQQLQYWDFEGGITVAVREGCSLIVGLRRDKVTLHLGEPSPRTFTLSTQS